MSRKCSGTCLEDDGSRRMVLSLTEQNIVMRVAGLFNEEGNQRWTVVLAGLYLIFNHTLEVLSQNPRRSWFTEGMSCNPVFSWSKGVLLILFLIKLGPRTRLRRLSPVSFNRTSIMLYKVLLSRLLNSRPSLLTPSDRKLYQQMRHDKWVSRWKTPSLLGASPLCTCTQLLQQRNSQFFLSSGTLNEIRVTVQIPRGATDKNFSLLNGRC